MRGAAATPAGGERALEVGAHAASHTPASLRSAPRHSWWLRDDRRATPAADAASDHDAAERRQDPPPRDRRIVGERGEQRRPCSRDGASGSTSSPRSTTRRSQAGSSPVARPASCGPATVAFISSSKVLPRNGRSPVSASYSVTQKLN